jgi:hypothetical protein
VKSLFETGTKPSDTQGQHLLAEIGPGHICLAILDRSLKRIPYIKYFQKEESEELPWREVATDLEGLSFSSVLICSAYPNSLLVPHSLQEGAIPMLESVYGSEGQQFFSDALPEWQLVNHYSLPETLYREVVSQYPDALFFHMYTPSIKVYNGYHGAEQISVHFTTTQFSVLVKKGNQLQLAQTYSYKTPLDVVYFLLKICTEFQLDQSETVLVLSGLIEEDSALYRELNHYFLNIHFTQANELSVADSTLPAHFFTSLYNLATCAS